MAAPVFQRDHAAIVEPVQDHRLATERPRKNFILQLIGECRDVPLIK